MSEDDFLAVLGPAWSKMTPAQRLWYGPKDEHGQPIPLETPEPTYDLDAVAELVTIARWFPRAIETEGLVVVARRWSESPTVIALAEALVEPSGDETCVDSGLRHEPALSPETGVHAAPALQPRRNTFWRVRAARRASAL